MLSECCIQEAVLDFNERLIAEPADSSITVDVNSHLPGELIFSSFLIYFLYFQYHWIPCFDIVLNSNHLRQ